MEGILEARCGLDVRKEIVAACTISKQEASGKAKNPLSIEIKAFKALPDELQHQKRWIEEHVCYGAAMESAGVTVARYAMPWKRRLTAKSTSLLSSSAYAQYPRQEKRCKGCAVDIAAVARGFA
ncbi:MAG: hypothetical protein LBU32_01830 [Clostridiales bacterium]|jgi:hypothetical protein|nr:hypothetical protein [Clostridiales bacterium]